MARRIRRLPRCQRRGCAEPVSRAVRIELPGIDLGSRPATTVYVGLCPRCAREVSAGARLTQAALVTLPALVEQAGSARRRVRELEGWLREAEGAVAFQRERASRVERE